MLVTVSVECNGENEGHGEGECEQGQCGAEERTGDSTHTAGRTARARSPVRSGDAGTR